ncbi:MAG: hypothetical protein [Bacteriophage sp.]|nr:MAG: hypothetical protein [Bacteriophage sp.]
MTNKKYELTDESMELTSGVTVYRIKALRDFADVKEGQLGGFVQSEYNLSHAGSAWVFDDAMVLGTATVKDSAAVKDSAKVSGDAVISEFARVCEHAEVSGSATVQGRARVLGFASVGGKATIKDDAWVHGCASVHDYSVIGALTNLGGITQVHNHSKILSRGDAPASLFSNAVIRGNASIVRPNDILVISPLGSRYDRLTAYRNEQGGIDVTTGCFHGSLSEFKKQVRHTHGSHLYGERYRAAIAFIKTFFEIGKGLKKS